MRALKIFFCGEINGNVFLCNDPNVVILDDSCFLKAMQFCSMDTEAILSS